MVKAERDPSISCGPKHWWVSRSFNPPYDVWVPRPPVRSSISPLDRNSNRCRLELDCTNTAHCYYLYITLPIRTNSYSPCNSGSDRSRSIPDQDDKPRQYLYNFRLGSPPNTPTGYRGCRHLTTASNSNHPYRERLRCHSARQR